MKNIKNFGWVDKKFESIRFFAWKKLKRDIGREQLKQEAYISFWRACIHYRYKRGYNNFESFFFLILKRELRRNYWDKQIVFRASRKVIFDSELLEILVFKIKELNYFQSEILTYWRTLPDFDIIEYWMGNNDLTLDQIGYEYGVSKQRIGQRIQRCLKRMGVKGNLTYKNKDFKYKEF